MNKIETKERVKLFSNFIKEELMKVIVNVDEDDNLDSCYRLWLFNSKDGYFVSLSHYGLGELKAFVKLNCINPIIIDNFMFGNGFNLNKYTTEEELDKIANRIINEYNDLVDKETE